MWRGIAKHIGIREMDRGRYDAAHDIDYATGCAFSRGARCSRKIGDLDPGYRAYFEDADFCVRARQAGFRIRYVAGGQVATASPPAPGGQLSRRRRRRKLASSRRFFRAVREAVRSPSPLFVCDMVQNCGPGSGRPDS